MQNYVSNNFRKIVYHLKIINLYNSIFSCFSTKILNARVHAFECNNRKCTYSYRLLSDSQFQVGVSRIIQLTWFSAALHGVRFAYLDACFCSKSRKVRITNIGTNTSSTSIRGGRSSFNLVSNLNNIITEGLMSQTMYLHFPWKIPPGHGGVREHFSTDP